MASVESISPGLRPADPGGHGSAVRYRAQRNEKSRSKPQPAASGQMASARSDISSAALFEKVSTSTDFRIDLLFLQEFQPSHQGLGLARPGPSPHKERTAHKLGGVLLLWVQVESISFASSWPYERAARAVRRTTGPQPYRMAPAADPQSATQTTHPAGATVAPRSSGTGIRAQTGPSEPLAAPFYCNLRRDPPPLPPGPPNGPNPHHGLDLLRRAHRIPHDRSHGRSRRRYERHHPVSSCLMAPASASNTARPPPSIGSPGL